MSETQDQTEHSATILFADISDSTPLFEDTGNLIAYQIIGNTLDRHGAEIEKSGGVVIRSKGDDLLCTFADADAAVATARRILIRQSHSPVSIRIGLHFGSFVSGRGDIFGDAVNVASRLMTLARPDEGIASADLAEQLSDEWRSELLPFDTATLKGKSRETGLFRLLPPDDDTTEMVSDASALRAGTAVVPVAMKLECDGQTLVLDATRPSAMIGRADDADVQISNKRVSRNHATFRVGSGRAKITDSSTVGTWIVTQQGEIRVRRETVDLVGEGKIYLGGHPSENEVTVARYSVFRQKT